ncbi:formate/nitrite transporter family protein [Calorimonas adulescens]|uniref:Formate/nitrite transporter family protein n=1 Tax=Calorimonas adulescens TaxID=2606906 RepID=A0A5D8QAS2_9THEO|nr:formate/nitrite transporter family protein [Calorimonas adulescens]TZE81562.1 formate/nitrite transporter family protein [Calorimonas adulescens]
MNILSPAEIASVWIENGRKKANLSVDKMLLLGILAGIFIGFGANASIVVTQTLESNVDVGLAKFFGASVFPVGLMLVVIAGAELFTGNNLMTLALLDRKITSGKMLLNWSMVYIGNLVGSVVLAWLLAESGLYSSKFLVAKAVSIAVTKVSLPFMQAFIRGILCNMLVVLACWMQAGSKDMTGKILALWFPIMLFVLSGFEHSVANMFFIPLGKFLGADVTWGQFFINNIIPVTLGNIVGGAMIVPFTYYLCYVRRASLPEKESMQI